MPWTAVFQRQWTGVDCPVYRPVDMVNPRLNGTGTVTVLRVRTYREVRSRCTALISTRVVKQERVAKSAPGLLISFIRFISGELTMESTTK